MSEPNIQIEIPNTDIIYTAPAVDTGFNIIGFFESNAGPYEPTKYAGRAEFNKMCLTTQDVQMSDDDTVKHMNYLLNYTSMWGRRVGRMPLKQGVSSLGELLLFNESNELVDKFYTLDIKEWVDELDYYYMAYKGTCYYVGNIDNMDEIESQKFTEKIQVHKTKSVDLLVANLYKYVKDNIIILKVNDMTILAREEWTFSPNLSVTVTENVNKYTLVSNSQAEAMSTGDYLQIRGTSFYFQGDGSFNPIRLNSPVAIYSNTITENYDSGLFFLKVMDKVQDSQNAYTPMPEIRGDGGLVVTYKGIVGEWGISDGCNKKLEINDEKHALGIFDADDDITNGAITLSFHKDPVPPPPAQEEDVSLQNEEGVLTSDSQIDPGDNVTYKLSIASVENTDADNSTKELIITVGGGEVTRYTLDFTDNNTLSDILIEEMAIASSGVFKAEAEGCTFTTPKLTKVTQEEQTDEEKYGIDVKFFFVVGVPPSVAPEGSISINLNESGANALKTLNAIINTFDTVENEDLDDLIPTDFKLSTSGTFTAYFERRDSLMKGNKANSDIKSINIVNDGATVTYQYDFVSDSQMAGKQTNTNFWIRINNNVFYVGNTMPSIVDCYRIRLSKDPVTFSEFKSLFESSLSSYVTDSGMYQNRFSFLSDFEVEAQGIEFTKSTEKQYTSAQFAAIQKFSTTENSFMVKYERLDDYVDYEVYNLTLGYKDDSMSWDISFNKAAVDGYGRALYFDRVKYPYIDIVKLDGTGMLEALDTYKWGREIKPKEVTTADYVEAINKLNELENVWFDAIWDCGKTHPSISIAADAMANKLYMLNMVSLPIEYEYNPSGYQKLKEYASNLALDSRWSRIVWAKVRTGNVGNFAFEVNGSGLALRALIQNYAGGSTEFCAQMGVNYGKLEGEHLILPKKADRDELIDKFRIATVKGDGSTYPYHINDNTTTQSFKSSYSEEQNVRMSVALSHGLDRIFYTFLGLKNDFFTRDKLKQQFSDFIETRCVRNQIFSLDGYLVICDRSNNSDEDIAQNILTAEVFVKYPKAIKYGRLYINTMPLDSGNKTTS